MDARTHWTTQDRARHFIVPDEAELAPGPFALRTAAGRERTVDESAVAPFEVTEEEARAWAKEQLGAVFGELRGQTLGFVEQLRQKTAELREENRRTWEQAVADAPPDVREAGSRLRDMLKDLGATLRRTAREHGYDPGSAEPAPSASAWASPEHAQPADSSASEGAPPAGAVQPEDAASPADSQLSATPPPSVDSTGSTASAETTPADAPADPPAADRPPSTARPRVDAPAIRLRPEP